MESYQALVRRPSPRLAEGLLTHLERTPVDPDLAGRQWRGYVDALHAAGWETAEVAPLDDCPDSVFVEDTLVVYGRLAVVTRPGADSRKPETVASEEAVAALGYEVVRIEAPGTLDGGDVLKWAGRVWVGLSGRTNAEGFRQLREHLAPLGANVTAVPVERALHLKTEVTALPDGTILGYPALVDDVASWGDRFLAVPESSGAQVLLLGGNRVLMAASAPATAAMLRARGLEVICVDISEFEKCEGSVTCLSVRLRGLGGALGSQP